MRATNLLSLNLFLRTLISSARTRRAPPDDVLGEPLASFFCAFYQLVQVPPLAMRHHQAQVLLHLVEKMVAVRDDVGMPQGCQQIHLPHPVEFHCTVLCCIVSCCSSNSSGVSLLMTRRFCGPSAKPPTKLISLAVDGLREEHHSISGVVVIFGQPIYTRGRFATAAPNDCSNVRFFDALRGVVPKAGVQKAVFRTENLQTHVRELCEYNAQ